MEIFGEINRKRKFPRTLQDLGESAYVHAKWTTPEIHLRMMHFFCTLDDITLKQAKKDLTAICKTVIEDVKKDNLPKAMNASAVRRARSIAKEYYMLAQSCKQASRDMDKFDF